MLQTFSLRYCQSTETVTAHCFPDLSSDQLSVSALRKIGEIFENNHAHKLHTCSIKVNAAGYVVFFSRYEVLCEVLIRQETLSSPTLLPYGFV